MSRLPIPHFIQEIKTKLGFDRAMTAPGQDIVDAVNSVNDKLPTIVTATHFIPAYPSGFSEHDGGCYYSVYGNIVSIRIAFKLTGDREANTQVAIPHNIPSSFAPSVPIIAVISDGSIRGIDVIKISQSGFVVYTKQATGAEYFMGYVTYTR